MSMPMPTSTPMLMPRSDADADAEISKWPLDNNFISEHAQIQEKKKVAKQYQYHEFYFKSPT